MITTIIYDMNGVIIDDENLHELAFKKVCLELGIKLSHQNYKDLCMGKTDKEGFEEILKEFSINNYNIEHLITKKAEIYLKLLPSSIKTYPGVLKSLKRLSKNFRLALTSSSSKKEIHLITSILKIKDLFEVIVSADDVRKGKPDPEPYLITANKLGEKPKNCLVIEDSKSGVASAKAAGMRCIAITTTHKIQDLKKADFIIQNFSELTNNLIEEIGKK